MRRTIAWSLLVCVAWIDMAAASPQILSCPVLQSVCTENKWQTSTAQISLEWHVSHNGIDGIACDQQDETIPLRWNYAAQLVRIGKTACHYSLLSNDNQEIASMQLMSSQLTRTGSNWEATHPAYGFYKCIERQDLCKFVKR